MKYIFNIQTTVVVDSDELNVGDEEKARELLEAGFYREIDTETILAHVGH